MIDVDISSNTPTISGDISSNNPQVVANIDTSGVDINNLRVRVTNLENNAVGNIDMSYSAGTTTLTIVTKNIDNEAIGTAKTVVLPAGLTNLTYDEENKKLIVTLSNNTIINVSLKDSFDKIDRYMANLQSEVEELDLKKLDKIAYLSASDINNYFNE